MKRGQIWQLDFFIAIVISSTALVFFVHYITDQTGTTNVNDLAITASSMSESLMTQGLPLNWTNDTVRSVGLLTDSGRMNLTKVDLLYQMSQSQYRLFFTEKNRYQIQLLDLDNTSLTINGKTFLGFNASNASSSVVSSRYGLYDGEIVRLEVTVWQ